jgi:release factor glutamine methyltransferase
MQNRVPSTRPEWTIIKLIRWATEYFKTRDVEGPRTSAEILLAHILGVKPIDLYLRYDQPLQGDELSAFKVLLKRRVNREPVAYIVGRKGFWSIDLNVSDDVLIPRPETECLVESALDVLSQEETSAVIKILELGTGSGAVILSLAFKKPEHLYYASDVSPDAIGVAQANARQHHLEGKVHFFCGDWLSPLRIAGGCFDIILSNPPYIRTADMDMLQPEIRSYEPAVALDGGDDGLRCIGRIIDQAHQHLRPGGLLILEIGHDQREDVYRMMRACGRFEDFLCKKDYRGSDRVVQMRKKMLRTVV